MNQNNENSQLNLGDYPSVSWLLKDLDVAKDTLYNTGYYDIFFVGYDTLTIPIIRVINSFKTLYKADEIAGAKTFIRLMFDIILNLYAEYRYDTNAIKKIYAKGKALDDVYYKGEKLKPKEVRKELTSKYPELDGIYKKYSSFVHTSNFAHTLYRLPSDDKVEAVEDMKLSISVLLSLINEIKEGYITLIKEYGKYEEYLQNISIAEYVASNGEIVSGFEWLNTEELFSLDYEGEWHYYPYEEELEARYKAAPKFVSASDSNK